MSWNVWNRPSGSFIVDMGILSNIMQYPSPKCYMTFCDMAMTPSIDQTLHKFATLLPNLALLPILTLYPNFGGFHRTLQQVRLANSGGLLLKTPGPVPFGTCISFNVDTILSWICHVYGPFEFRTSLGTSILLLLTKLSPRPLKFDTRPIVCFEKWRWVNYRLRHYSALVPTQQLQFLLPFRFLGSYLFLKKHCILLPHRGSIWLISTVCQRQRFITFIVDFCLL